MGYVERVERNLAGLEAVSVGACPGCDECRSSIGGDDYRPELDDDTDRFTFPAADGAEWPTEAEAEAAAREAFADAWRSCRIDDDTRGFSFSDCGVCDTTLGGDRYVWHAIGEDGALLHFDDACSDCVLYLANGDVPERED